MYHLNLHTLLASQNYKFLSRPNLKERVFTQGPDLFGSVPQTEAWASCQLPVPQISNTTCKLTVI